jgi:hypothetical protein
LGYWPDVPSEVPNAIDAGAPDRGELIRRAKQAVLETATALDHGISQESVDAIRSSDVRDSATAAVSGTAFADRGATCTASICRIALDGAAVDLVREERLVAR